MQIKADLGDYSCISIRKRSLVSINIWLHITFQDLKINTSYKFYKIKPPVFLFAIASVTLDYNVLL